MVNLNKKEKLENYERGWRLYQKIQEIVYEEIDGKIFFVDDAVGILDKVKMSMFEDQVKSQLMALMDETRDEMQADQVEEKKKLGEGMEVR